MMNIKKITGINPNTVFMCGPHTPVIRLDETIAMHMVGHTKCIWYEVVAADNNYGLVLESFEYWDYGK